MSQILSSLEAQSASVVALISGTRSLTYGEMLERIELYAESLSQVSTLAIHLDNGIEWVLWDLAALFSNTTCVPIPGFFSGEQVNHIISAAGITHIVDEQGIRAIEPVRAIHSGPVTMPEGTAKITFTSGTTGTPKGVCLSQTGIEELVISIQNSLDNRFAAHHAVILPLAILLGNLAGLYTTLIAGGTVHVPSLHEIGLSNPFEPDLPKLATYLATQEITSTIAVPELLRGLMATQISLPCMKFMAVGGAKIAPELIDAARIQGLPVYEGYGLSEAASVVALNTPGTDKPGSVGKVLDHIDLTIKDGEILISSHAFLGYLGGGKQQPFPTGDLGFLDKDGYLHISGRKKNVIITSHGRNISPEWVESALLAQPGIGQVMVYGQGQAETVSAFIVPTHPNANVRQAVSNANSTLPEYAQIKTYKLVSPFSAKENTLTANGRPKRDQILKQHLVAE